ncbi:conserved protein, unknown function [Plasmodium vivax]|uniref:ER membrane protein complex subunit 8 n=4 Tax=Plasmodium vivax TaxID=5855 RepID=A5K556_PLAVS|nr:hypothetical protein, conserved [Plasmodium vivax]KMZ86538.1 hypothetical protein PVBG_04697 [Plasmodium vivax Brazil I]KMZ99398.1 hypothetical protein PVNG_04194 [Plasmodium vivax North Korean]EDL45784.1 hypothetical protein, conserved [Plasmodium vivax]CAG9477180.1 unnamed protein product [Plasmodium vivax]CAI7720683.1 ER membrane protein complex subunit 8, putative [Plasmodium vivax]|eukprot:XP_001615511.1 hypothetical protein [Plasmodium vivax Sal-1]
MKETEISIENAAYAKMFMHGLKNSYDDVCGILIGKYSDVEKKKQRCVITDSIPLFHTHILSPFLNLAFTLVENHYKGKEERIIGYYHISVEDSKNDDIKNVKVCELVANKLVKNYSDAMICLVQLSKLESDDANCLNVFMQDDATEEWKNCDVEVTRNNKDFLKMSLSNNEYLNLHDFDDHLNCINHDFMNSNLFNNV